MEDRNNDSLRDRLNRSGDSIEYWDPEVGDVVIGEIINVDVRMTKHSGRSPVLTIADEITGRPIEVWGLHTVLRSELKKLRPSAGDRIGIKRLADAGKGYRRYVVEVDGDQPDVDWDAVPTGGSDMDPPDLTDETAKLIGVTKVDRDNESDPPF